MATSSVKVVRARNITLSGASRRRVLRAAFFTPSIRNGNRIQWGLPVLMWGPPGGGKTSELRALAYDLHASCFIFSPGEQGEGGIGAMPIPALDGYIDYPAPRWSQPFFQDDGFGMLGLDELTTADARMQPAMLAAALERNIGGRTMGGRVRVMAASNAVEDTPGGCDLSPPLANRFVHLDFVDPDVDAFMDYMTTENGIELAPAAPFDALAEEARVLREWPLAWGNACAAVGSYLKAFPDKLRVQPKPTDANYGREWASPRSWDMATRCIAAAAIHGLTLEERHALIGGCVSVGIAGELLSYLRELDLPSAADVLTGKVTWDMANRLDRTMAVLRGVTAYALGVPKTSPKYEETVVLWWKFMERASATRADLAVARVQEGLRAAFHASATHKAFFPASTKTLDILSDAGLL